MFVGDCVQDVSYFVNLELLQILSRVKTGEREVVGYDGDGVIGRPARKALGRRGKGFDAFLFA